MSKYDIVINRITGVVKKIDPKSELYLFGSRATGKAKKDSDWDLLVLLNQKEIPFNFETKIMDDFYEVALETGTVISPLIYSKQEWNTKYAITPLYEAIKKEGIKLL